MAFSWSFRRQLAVVGILAFFLFLVVGSVIYFFIPSPTCFDNSQNQEEEGVDCGGSCKPCAEQVRDLAILWTRFFPIRTGGYDIAALVENRNQFYAATRLVYAVKMYDKENVLIAVRDGITYANTGERFIIFESNFPAQHRIPARAILEIREVAWVSREAKPLPVDILSKDVSLVGSETTPRVEVKIKNRASEVFRNIEVHAILLSANDEAIGASRTFLDELGLQEEANLIFTWPEPIAGVSSAEIYLRIAP